MALLLTTEVIVHSICLNKETTNLSIFDVNIVQLLFYGRLCLRKRLCRNVRANCPLSEFSQQVISSFQRFSGGKSCYLLCKCSVRQGTVTCLYRLSLSIVPWQNRCHGSTVGGWLGCVRQHTRSCTLHPHYANL